MPTAMRGLALLAVACLWAAPATADSWAAPQVHEEFSASRDHFVRVVPGDSLGDVVGFGRSPKGAYAQAEFYTRQPDRSYRLMHTVTLPNPVAPGRFLVSDDGRLVTIDNWHNVGFGTVLAVYDPAGKPVTSYALADLFSDQETDRMPHSVSSIHWHQGPVYLNPDQRTLYMMIEEGRDLVLGLETGRFAYCETRDGAYVCRDSNAERHWRSFAEIELDR